LTPFQNREFYNFSFSNGNVNLNANYQFCSSIFDVPSNLLKESVNIAKHLFEQGNHPSIKSGDLFVALFNEVELDGKPHEVVGIFKSENPQTFIKVNQQGTDFTVDVEHGINISKLDKGCLVFNCEKAEGYKVCVVDNTNRGTDAQFWKDEFLQVKPAQDNFHSTKDFLTLCKNFVTKQLPNEFEVDKTQQIDMLNRSINYFKEQDDFDVQDFTQSVIQHPEVIESFNQFKRQYETENEVEFADSFEISDAAVKKQNRVFKSVLKLDKNFHIYIHGDRNLIEKGVDKDGRKYYKIYFDEEQ
jgi:hypothetical protein